MVIHRLLLSVCNSLQYEHTICRRNPSKHNRSLILNYWDVRYANWWNWPSRRFLYLSKYLPCQRLIFLSRHTRMKHQFYPILKKLHHFLFEKLAGAFAHKCWYIKRVFQKVSLNKSKILSQWYFLMSKVFFQRNKCTSLVWLPYKTYPNNTIRDFAWSYILLFRRVHLLNHWFQDHLLVLTAHHVQDHLLHHPALAVLVDLQDRFVSMQQI